MVDSLCRKCGVKNGAHAPNCPDYERAEVQAGWPPRFPAGADEAGDTPPPLGPVRFWVFVRERMDPYVVASAEDLAKAFADAKAENIPSALTSGYRVRRVSDVRRTPPTPRAYGIDWDTVQEVYEVAAEAAEEICAIAVTKERVLG